MTQEELDALMSEGDSGLQSIDTPESSEESVGMTDEIAVKDGFDPDNFRVQASRHWPPPPPTEDHKVVHQLDEVTKDTEVKGTQIFDQLEIMGDSAGKIQKQAKSLKQYLETQEELFSKLCVAFPHIQSFQNALESTQSVKDNIKGILSASDEINDASMQAMDLMQYQDIHRQKIERVINVMRALAQYMNSLFEGKIDDSKRVSSAVFIAGDNKDDVANEEDIEALIASFGAKQ